MKIIIILLLLVSLTAFTQKQLPKEYRETFSYIPSGSAICDGEIVSIQQFFVSKGEVTNKEYRTFLEDLDKNGETKKLEIAQIKNQLWIDVFEDFRLEVMAEKYHKNEDYDDYPVVNITKEAALLYCDWLSKKLNEAVDENYVIKVRIPTRAEFIRAGALDTKEVEYAWGDSFMRNREGQFLCNFKRLPQSRITKDINGNFVVMSFKGQRDYSMDILAPSISYFPNDVDVYNLNGNAAEMIADSKHAAGGSWKDYGYDVRLQSLMPFDDASPLVGFRPVLTFLPKEFLKDE